MKSRYCYWSVATGEYSAMMVKCLASAREAGVFKEFHILTDTEIRDSECYDWMGLDLADGMFKMGYLKAAISRLNYDYYIWVDADTVFTANPDQILKTLGRSPIHVPLVDVPENPQIGANIRSLSFSDYRQIMLKAGLFGRARISRSAFWIVKRAAVDIVCELAQHYYAVAKSVGVVPHGDCALSYAMQMLCADPDAHLANLRPDLWGSDDCCEYQFDGRVCRQFKGGCTPAVLHQPVKRRLQIEKSTNSVFLTGCEVEKLEKGDSEI